MNQTKGNETSIRTKLDPVSVLGSFNPNIKQVSTKTINPITAHNLDQLDNMDNEYIGKGRITKQPRRWIYLSPRRPKPGITTSLLKETRSEQRNSWTLSGRKTF